MQQLHSIEAGIIQKLQNSQLSIPQTQIPFLNEPQSQQIKKKNYLQLLKQKRQMVNKLKSIEEEEKSYLHQSRMMQKKQKNKFAQRSEFTEQDRQKIKKLRKKYKKFEREVQKKTREVEQIKIIKKKIEEQQNKNLYKLINDQKKNVIQQKLTLLKCKASQRKQLKKITDSNVKQLEKKQKLYEILFNKWKQRSNEQIKQKYQLMKKRAQNKYVDLNGLKLHQKKYEQIILQKKKQLQRKRLSYSQLSHNNQSNSISKMPSKFYTIVMQEERQAKQEEYKKKQRNKMLRIKKQQYSQDIREEFSQKMKSLSPKSTSQNQQIKCQPLTVQEIKQIGKSYLILGNKQAKKIIQKSNNEGSQNTNLKINRTNGGRTCCSRYHESLPETKRKTNEDEDHHEAYKSTKNEVKKIMKDQSLKKDERIGKLQMLATRFNSSNADVVTKIKGKLEILQAIH